MSRKFDFGSNLVEISVCRDNVKNCRHFKDNDATDHKRK